MPALLSARHAFNGVWMFVYKVMLKGTHNMRAQHNIEHVRQ
jgi:hypothetical protein